MPSVDAYGDVVTGTCGWPLPGFAGAPHLLQNAVPAGMLAPQRMQNFGAELTCRVCGAPQELQKRCPSFRRAPQRLQTAVIISLFHPANWILASGSLEEFLGTHILERACKASVFSFASI